MLSPLNSTYKPDIALLARAIPPSASSAVGASPAPTGHAGAGASRSLAFSSVDQIISIQVAAQKTAAESTGKFMVEAAYGAQMAEASAMTGWYVAIPKATLTAKAATPASASDA